MGIIEVKSASQTFVSKKKVVTALKEATISVQDGQFVSFIGPSGCGKSTLLNMIAGLIIPTSGSVTVEGKLIHTVNTKVGYLTQEDSLLPWRTIISNVELPLEIRGVPKEKRRKAAEVLIEKVGLKGFENMYPREMSGGMKRRVALCQVLIYDPKIILMDEPFSALDAQTKLLLMDDLLRLWNENKKTVVYVTHDLNEAISLSDRIYLMTARPGRVKNEFEVGLARPRKADEAQFFDGYKDIYSKIWVELRDEVNQSISRERQPTNRPGEELGADNLFAR